MPNLDKLSKKLDKSKLTFIEKCNDLEIVNSIQEELTNHGKMAGLTTREIPARIKICSEEWAPTTGLVTAALKIRRKKIQEVYQKDIISLLSK